MPGLAEQRHNTPSWPQTRPVLAVLPGKYSSPQIMRCRPSNSVLESSRTTPLHYSERSGFGRRERGGKLLSNPIYTGRIAHKGELFPGQQPALIDDETWSTVRDQLAANERPET